MNPVDLVLSNDFCIGCGNCVHIENSHYSMNINEIGAIIATDRSTNDAASNFSSENALGSVCPFADESLREDAIGHELFPNTPFRSPYLGNYELAYGGHVKEGEFRGRGTSGGMSKWIGAELLKENKIDYFIQVAATGTNSPLFKYMIFDSASSVLDGSKACYYPVSLDEVYKIVKSHPGRYAITAIPCFTKSIRLMQRADVVIKERIAFVVGIICGGLKTANYAKFIAMQYPIPFDKVRSIDFRRKTKDSPARVQASTIAYQNDEGNLVDEWRPNSSLKGLDYGMGLFKPKACDFCDDVVGELADISVGDAWLPEFVRDSDGDSIIVIRNSEVSFLVQKGLREGRLALSELDERDVVASQAAGFRHRREGLVVRLEEERKAGRWVPNKRDFGIQAHKISKQRRAIYKLRAEISAGSHDKFLEALEEGSIEVFLNWLGPMHAKYKDINKPSLMRRVIKKITKGRIGGG
ncbi:Coenzyme F420 hydrogenase/dehydrogenase, beta subunit C-terminal domain [Spongiibacter taiwanensis]|uniref:Coenzyme F420 hydrogenase/dehydrogenase, beta subunit C-terminal domain n=1 Tax=Spongiibacter taiwanensis TaxID=1748242 RepID=UPI002034FC76|nr:Coenzyme F420 hydrogenase/dehydrogenase, beta subunit C-terminal domain [Spongiibacter taiwanensis]USA42146.1 Coenzyme F420 hydrogenase/dehydrogenase, beta subunit C-terminal domain [Spongiibacter taiwanensis]